MARTAEQVLREILGAKDMQIATLTAQLEAARETIAALEAKS